MSERLRNREVPFPKEEIIGNNQELENMIVDYLKIGQLIDYDTLPDTITSGGIDRYATWLAELTAKDPEHRERGASIHLRDKQDPFIFPTNPNIGNHDSAEIVSSHNIYQFVPLVRAHSHPNTTGPSHIDLRRPIANLGTDQDLAWYADIIGTQGNNYLIFKTAQTETTNPEAAIEYMDHVAEGHKNTASTILSEFDTLSNSIGEKRATVLKPILILCIQHTEIEKYGVPFLDFSATHSTPHFISQQYKLGFYYSGKDGIFKQITESVINDIDESYSEVLDKGFDLFEKVTKNAGTLE